MHSRITKKYLTSGYKHTLNYEHPNNKKNSANINKKKKIGKSFLNILDKYFFPHFKL